MIYLELHCIVGYKAKCIMHSKSCVHVCTCDSGVGEVGRAERVRCWRGRVGRGGIEEETEGWDGREGGGGKEGGKEGRG